MLLFRNDQEMDNRILCPVCGSDRTNKLYTVDSLQVSKWFASENSGKLLTIKKKIEELWGRNISTYQECLNCTFEFADPFTPADASLYSLIYHSETNYPAEKWEYTASKESIRQFIETLNQSPVLLEIGAGNGSFLKGLSDLPGQFLHIYATEYSEAGARAIESLGITCFRKDFIKLKPEEVHTGINIVCMFQVLEHMTSIHEFFGHLNKLAAQEARLFISVPNNEQRRFYDRLGYILDLPPVHVGRYNPACLAVLSNQHGWRIIQHKIQQTTYSQRLKKFLFEQF